MNSQGVQGAPLSVAPEAQHSPRWPAGLTSHRLRLHAFYRMKTRLLESGKRGGGTSQRSRPRGLEPLEVLGAPPGHPRQHHAW